MQVYYDSHVQAVLTDVFVHGGCADFPLRGRALYLAAKAAL
jgi:hypothetical protein